MVHHITHDFEGEMASDKRGQLHILPRDGSVGSSNEEDNDEDNEWEAFDAAFRGKTAVVATPSTPAMAAAAATPANATTRYKYRFFQDHRNEAAIEDGIGQAQLTSFPSGAHRNVGNFEEEGRRLESVCLVGVEGKQGQVDRPALLGENREHHWVDSCSGSRSSSSSSDSSKIPIEAMGLLMTARGEDACERDSTSLRFAPWHDGDGDSIAPGGESPHQRNHDFEGGGRNHPNAPTYSKKHHDHQHVRHQPARRLPLSVDSNTSARRRQQQDQHHHHQQGADDAFIPISRVFAWSVLLHGCLCEAPLAVIEGLSRGPLYLAAAAWVALVALVGASGQPAHRAELAKHAAALAREGLLFLVASLTLAVPFSTTCTVYGEVSEDAAWDVRPVPTALGDVDPLRFFVFAFGQAGELAANGRPEPLRQQERSSLRNDPHHSSGKIFRSPSPVGGVVAGDHWRPGAAPTSRSSSACGFVGAIAAESMDADRLGAGLILHPPHELGRRFRRVGATGGRAVVLACRRLATNAARSYRRLGALGILVARVRRRGSGHGAGSLNDVGGLSRSSVTGSGRTDEGVLV